MQLDAMLQNSTRRDPTHWAYEYHDSGVLCWCVLSLSTVVGLLAMQQQLVGTLPRIWAEGQASALASRWPCQLVFLWHASFTTEGHLNPGSVPTRVLGHSPRALDPHKRVGSWIDQSPPATQANPDSRTGLEPDLMALCPPGWPLFLVLWHGWLLQLSLPASSFGSKSG